jgi:hypothetical protein
MRRFFSTALIAFSLTACVDTEDDDVELGETEQASHGCHTINIVGTSFVNTPLTTTTCLIHKAVGSGIGMQTGVLFDFPQYTTDGAYVPLAQYLTLAERCGASSGTLTIQGGSLFVDDEWEATVSATYQPSTVRWRINSCRAFGQLTLPESNGSQTTATALAFPSTIEVEPTRISMGSNLDLP